MHCRGEDDKAVPDGVVEGNAIVDVEYDPRRVGQPSSDDEPERCGREV